MNPVLLVPVIYMSAILLWLDQALNHPQSLAMTEIALEKKLNQSMILSDPILSPIHARVCMAVPQSQTGMN